VQQEPVSGWLGDLTTKQRGNLSHREKTPAPTTPRKLVRLLLLVDVSSAAGILVDRNRSEHPSNACHDVTINVVAVDRSTVTVELLQRPRH
jgi:hypothetical protein